MKVVILAGGFGTRLSEYTKTLPKPMVKVNGKPLLTRIMEHYFKYGFNNFYIALGYKGYEIKKYSACTYRRSRARTHTQSPTNVSSEALWERSPPRGGPPGTPVVPVRGRG